MSVTGFLKDGSIQKYDYNALENKPDNGLTEATKSALLQLARKVAYIDEHGEDYYQDLYDSFYGNFVNVTHLLTNCYSSNTSATAKIGVAYTAIISPDPGCTLTGATVSITMGGTDVTGFYSNGAINIPNVTGDLVITVTAMSAVSSISAVYTQSGEVYTTDSLDSLKADLVVTAVYSDSSTETVAAEDYTLSGTLAKGTSTITVSYGGKTTTFDVAVTGKNYVVVGNPVFDGDWIIPAQSNGGFVKTNKLFAPGSDTWTIRTEIQTPDSHSGSQDVFGSVDSNNSSYRSLLLEINNTRYTPYLSSNGASWNISIGSGGTGIGLQSNTVYLLELFFDGAKYGIRASDDGGNTWPIEWLTTSSAPIIGGYAVGFGVVRNLVYNGKLNLAKTKIYVNGSLWWSAL